MSVLSNIRVLKNFSHKSGVYIKDEVKYIDINLAKQFVNSELVEIIGSDLVSEKTKNSRKRKVKSNE